MRSTQYQKRILTGSISENVGLRDGSNLAKFHSFIIKVNNSAYFWTITAGLLLYFLHLLAGGVRPMIAKHAGRNRKTVHSYQHRRRVHVKLL